MTESEKYTKGFLTIFVAYLAVLIILFFAFVLPALFANVWGDSGLYMVLGIIFAPLVLMLIYVKISRFTFLWGKEWLFRYIVMAACIASIAFSAIFILPIV